MVIRAGDRIPNGIQTEVSVGLNRHFVPLDVNFADDAKVLAVSIDAQLLYVRGLCMAKRLQSDGYLCEKQIARLAGDLRGTAAGLTAELTREGLWEDARTDARGRARAGCAIARWADWNPSAAELNLKREKDSERKRRARARPLGLEPDSDEELELEPRERARESYSDEFETCWKLYPRKLNRKGALKAFQARRRENVSFADLLNATTAYSEQRSGENPDFSMHGATFYGPNERWKDFLEEPEKPVEKPRPACPDHGRSGDCFFHEGQGWVHAGTDE